MSAQLYWCSRCERTLLAAQLHANNQCPVCASATERISWLTAALRKVSQGPERRTDLQQKHLQLIQAIWTADGLGQRYFEICQPGSMYYSRFVRRVTELICQGIEEGWIGLTLPAQPLAPQARYSIEYRDPERFVRELQLLFPEQGATPGSQRARTPASTTASEPTDAHGQHEGGWRAEVAGKNASGPNARRDS